MKKLLFLSTLFIFACSSDSEGNPCIYEPTLETNAVTDIDETSATLNGVISIVSENCEVAPGEMQGFVYSTNPSPTNDDNVEVVYGTDISTTIDNLIPNTTYYVRVFITNSLGEFYGNEMEFTTNEEIIGLVNCDGNPVPTIVYGTQEWTVENACHTTYRDGTPIPQVIDQSQWITLTTGAWCYIDNDPNKGVLYNWYAVSGIHDNDDSTPNKEFAPDGWKVPSNGEWNTLRQFLVDSGYNFDGSFGNYNANSLAKAVASQSGWYTPNQSLPGEPGYNQSTNNSSGFNAFPMGQRELMENIELAFRSYQGSAFFWSSTQLQGSDWAVGHFYIGSGAPNFNYYHTHMEYGYSVRLVKD